MHLTATHMTFVVTVLVSAVLLATAPFVCAADTTVVNSISVSSHSGGNVANGGRVVEGRSSASADITTIVNGEVVEDVHEHVTSDDAPVSINRTMVATSTNARVQTRVQLDADTDTNTQEQGTSRATHEDALAPQSSAATTTAETSTTAIINRNDTGTGSQARAADARAQTLLTRIVDSVTRAFAYVLSKLFS